MTARVAGVFDLTITVLCICNPRCVWCVSPAFARPAEIVVRVRGLKAEATVHGERALVIVIDLQEGVPGTVLPRPREQHRGHACSDATAAFLAVGRDAVDTGDAVVERHLPATHDLLLAFRDHTMA